jgi:hypothetical protein
MDPVHVTEIVPTVSLALPLTVLYTPNASVVELTLHTATALARPSNMAQANNRNKHCDIFFIGSPYM